MLPTSCQMDETSTPVHQRVAVSLAVLPGQCWRCGGDVMPIVGVFASDGARRRWLEFPAVAARLAVVVRRQELATLGIGPIKVRTSRARPGGYLANGCVDCDAILGDHPLREDLVTFLAEGGNRDELIVATFLRPRRHARSSYSARARD